MSTQASSKKGAKQKLCLFAIKYLCPVAIKYMVEKFKQKKIIKEDDKQLEIGEIVGEKQMFKKEKQEELQNQKIEALQQQSKLYLNSKEKRKLKLKLKRKNQQLQAMQPQKKVQTEQDSLQHIYKIENIVSNKEQQEQQHPIPKEQTAEVTIHNDSCDPLLLLQESCKHLKTTKTSSQQKELSVNNDEDFEIELSKPFVINKSQEDITVLLDEHIAKEYKQQIQVVEGQIQMQRENPIKKQSEFDNMFDEPLFKIKQQIQENNIPSAQEQKQQQTVIDLCSDNENQSEVGEQPFVQKNFHKKEINERFQIVNEKKTTAEIFPEIQKIAIEKQQKQNKKKQSRLLVQEDLRTLETIQEVKQHLGVIDNYFKQKVVSLPLSFKLNEFFKYNLAQSTKFLKFFIELLGYFDELEFGKAFEQDSKNYHLAIITKKKKFEAKAQPQTIKQKAKTMEQAYYQTLLMVIKERYNRCETMQQVYEQFTKKYKQALEKEKEKDKELLYHKKLINSTSEQHKQVSNNKELNNMFEDIEGIQVSSEKEKEKAQKTNHQHANKEDHNKYNRSDQKQIKLQSKYHQHTHHVQNSHHSSHIHSTHKKQHHQSDEEPDYNELARRLALMKKGLIEEEDNTTDKCGNGEEKQSDNMNSYEGKFKKIQVHRVPKQIIVID